MKSFVAVLACAAMANAGVVAPAGYAGYAGVAGYAAQPIGYAAAAVAGVYAGSYDPSVAYANLYPAAEPYVHVQVPAEPYVHEEAAAEPYVDVQVPAEPYVHEEAAAEPVGSLQMLFINFADSLHTLVNRLVVRIGPCLRLDAWLNQQNGVCHDELISIIPCRSESSNISL